MDRSALFFVGLLLLACPLAWGQESPLTVTVGNGGAGVLSGPDEVHYVTSELEPGIEVKIYRLDPGRWCAIRPPDDSFSLVRAAAIEIVDEDRGVAQINTVDERCWIGTMMGKVDEPMWQIKLKRGERVRVLGSIPSETDPAQPEWYQIAPPSGEFRWMRWSDLDDDSRQRALEHFESSASGTAQAEPKTVLVKSDSVRIPTDSQSDASTNSSSKGVALARYDQPSADRPTLSATQSKGQWRAPQRRRPIENFTANQTSPTTYPSGFAAPDPTRRADIAQTPTSWPEAIPNGPTKWSQALQELDLRLSVEVLKEPAQWQLDSLATDVMRFKTSGANPSDTATADHLLNKIRQFQILQNGSGRSNTQTPPPQIQGVVAVVGQDSIPMQRSAVGQIDQSNAAYAQSFDAHGWLNELVRDGGMGQSTYVLQDETGKITHLISATPGLNLHRYLKTKIGIAGQKGFHEGMKLDHITAERIVNLDTLRR